MGAAKFVQTDFTTQDSVTYKTSIDADIQVHNRIAGMFAPHQSSPAAMTITIDAGDLFVSNALVSQAAQTSGAIGAPSSDPRIDRAVIDALTGALSIVPGVEAGSPAPPAIPARKLPVAQIALIVGQSSIINANILDERIGIVPGFAFPPGTQLDWPSETLPARALERNGASLSRTTYADLFSVIGTIYGAADIYSFNLPDDRGKFPRYWDHGKGVDPDRASRTAVAVAGATMVAGDHVGTEENDDVVAHSHPIYNVTDNGGGPKRYVLGGATGTYVTLATGNSAAGNETRPRNKYVMPIIFY